MNQLITSRERAWRYWSFPRSQLWSKPGTKLLLTAMWRHLCSSDRMLLIPGQELCLAHSERPGCPRKAHGCTCPLPISTQPIGYQRRPRDKRIVSRNMCLSILSGSPHPNSISRFLMLSACSYYATKSSDTALIRQANRQSYLTCDAVNRGGVWTCSSWWVSKYTMKWNPTDDL